MVFQIIMLVCMLPIVPIIYVMLANETKPKKNIILGVTLPYEAREDAAVIRICSEYRRNLKISTLILVLCPIAFFFVPWFSVVLTLYMLWIDVVLIVPYLIFIKANQKLKALKKENKWFSEWSELTVVDTKAASAEPKRLSLYWMLPPVLISLIPLVVTLCTQLHSDELGWMLFGYGINFLIVLLFVFLQRIIYRQKKESVDDNTDISLALTRVRQYNWSKFFLWIIYLTAIFSLLFWLFIYNGTAMLIISVVYTLLLLVVSVRSELVTRVMQEKLSSQTGKLRYKDEDEHWIFGLFYYNPNDRHFIVNARVGIGTTINLALPSGKILMGFTALLLAAMPLLGVWCMTEEFTPLQTKIIGGEVLVEHLNIVFEENIDNIASTEMLETLPRLGKVVGTETDNLLKGKFHQSDWGDCRVYLNPQKGPFLKLTLRDGNIVLIGGKEETLHQIATEVLQ